MPETDLPWNAPTASGAEFQPTAWTDLRAIASGADPVRQRDALERICQVYWKPIYAFIRRRGQSPEAARDLTQDFFYHLLRKERLKLADHKRGRFRSFVLKSLQNFLASDFDRRFAQKRDERVVVSLDEPLDDDGRTLDVAGGSASPDVAFDRLWALDLLAAVRRRLETELRAENRSSQLRLLPLAVLEDADTKYAEVATELGMSESAVKKAIERLRDRWEQALREEIAATVQSPDEVETELRELLAVLAA
jgi:RNA polymerase sigma-70 factor (ECF subfamily)